MREVPRRGGRRQCFAHYRLGLQGLIIESILGRGEFRCIPRRDEAWAVGDQRFIGRAKACRVLHDNLREVPRFQRDADRPSLAILFNNTASPDLSSRNRMIHTAHVVHHYTLKEVGDHVRLHYTTVSKIIREQRRMLQRKT